MNYIELNAFVKMHWASTGGQAKLLIRSGEILLNGNVETRNKKKLYAGDVITYKDQSHTVTEEQANGS